MSSIPINNCWFQIHVTLFQLNTDFCPYWLYLILDITRLPKESTSTATLTILFPPGSLKHKKRLTTVWIVFVWSLSSLHLVSHKGPKGSFTAFLWWEDGLAAAQHFGWTSASEMETSGRPISGGKHGSGWVFVSHTCFIYSFIRSFIHCLCVLLGIEVKFKNLVYPVILSPALVAELNTVTCTEDGGY